MAGNDGLERMRQESQSLREVPLSVVIPSVWPDATSERQGTNITQWHTPAGKVNVKTNSYGSDSYKFWSGPAAGKGKGRVGAIDFLLDAGVFQSVSEARRYLAHLDPSRVEVAITERKQSISITQSQDQPQEFRLPMRTFDPAKNLKHLTDYLVGERKLPRELIESLARNPHPPFYAGFGTKYGDYIVFPCRDHSLPQAISSHSASPPSPTGAILRWRHADRLPPKNQFGGQKAPMPWGSRRDLGWWQVGQGHDTLIITEAPIDGLTIRAATADNPAVASTTILATGGTGGLLPRQFQGFGTVLLATDNDLTGDKIAGEARALAGPGQTVSRVRPPSDFKDWNAAWQANPEVVKEAWNEALRGVEKCLEKGSQHDEYER